MPLGSVFSFLFFILLAAVPAYYLNKWMIRITRPKESLKGFLFYTLLSIGIAVIYAGLFILFVVVVFNPSRK